MGPKCCWGHARFAFLLAGFETQWIHQIKINNNVFISEIIRATVNHDLNDYGSYINDSGDHEPTTFLPIKDIDIFEPDSKFDNVKNHQNLRKIIQSIKSGNKLPPVLVRRIGNRYQILDGHHRFKAYRTLNKKYIPVKIISKTNVKDIHTRASIPPVYESGER